jgi:hypothetical protein
LLALIECGRIGVEVAEVIAPFLVYPLCGQAVDIDNSPIPGFADAEKKIADLTAQNANKILVKISMSSAPNISV